VVLEAISQVRIDENLCRLANVRRRLEALAALRLTFADRDEVLIFLGGDGDPEELLDAPLRTDPTFSPGPTRFSDGSWRVFYGAVGWDTAEAEVGYHVMRAAAGTTSPLYYQRLECAMDGDGYDLRAHVAIWPFLADQRESVAYPDCQSLALEARGNGAEGLVTISARRPAGINVPVFNRRALSDPRIVGSAAISTDVAGFHIERRP
jgi:hypothetical protein